MFYEENKIRGCKEDTLWDYHCWLGMPFWKGEGSCDINDDEVSWKKMEWISSKQGVGTNQNTLGHTNAER